MKISKLHLCAVLLIALSLTSSAWSYDLMNAELKPETSKAFNHYVQVVETRLHTSQPQKGAPDNQPFLWMDTLPADHHDEIIHKLQKGELVIEKMTEKESGHDIPVPGGMVHHWVGTIFVPGATVQQVLALLQDYDHHKDLYKPEVVDSKLLSHNGNTFKSFLRFYKKKIIGVTLNTEHEANYFLLSPTRAASEARATRIAEVEHAGENNEKEKPVGKGLGTLWALNSYWRFEDRDGGVYIQCEAVSLSRDIPNGLGWLIKPFITDVPKESLTTTLNATRSGLQKINAK